MDRRTSGDNRWTDGSDAQHSERHEIDNSPGGQLGIERTWPGNDRFDPYD